MEKKYIEPSGTGRRVRALIGEWERRPSLPKATLPKKIFLTEAAEAAAMSSLHVHVPGDRNDTQMLDILPTAVAISEILDPLPTVIVMSEMLDPLPNSVTASDTTDTEERLKKEAMAIVQEAEEYLANATIEYKKSRTMTVRADVHLPPGMYPKEESRNKNEVTPFPNKPLSVNWPANEDLVIVMNEPVVNEEIDEHVSLDHARKRLKLAEAYLLSQIQDLSNILNQGVEGDLEAGLCLEASNLCSGDSSGITKMYKSTIAMAESLELFIKKRLSRNEHGEKIPVEGIEMGELDIEVISEPSIRASVSLQEQPPVDEPTVVSSVTTNAEVSGRCGRCHNLTLELLNCTWQYFRSCKDPKCVWAIAMLIYVGIGLIFLFFSHEIDRALHGRSYDAEEK